MLKITKRKDMNTIKLKIILSLLLAVLSWGTSNAQTAFTFKGKIGNYPVVMELYGIYLWS